MRVQFDDDDLSDIERCIRILRALDHARGEEEGETQPDAPETLQVGMPAERRQELFEALMALPFKNPVEHRLLQVWRNQRPEEQITYDELWHRCGDPDRRVFAAANMHLGRMFFLAKYYGQGLWQLPQGRTRVDGQLRYLFQVNLHIHPDATGGANLRIA